MPQCTHGPEPRHALGASLTPNGVHFAVRTPLATAVTLCLDAEDGTEHHHEMTRDEDSVWHVHIDAIDVGRCYGFRVEGPWDPARGVRTNPAKLLLDPYGHAVHGTVNWGPEVLDHDVHDPSRSIRSNLDSAAHVPRSVVVDPDFDWGDDAPPRVPWQSTVIYEAHLAGLTKAHPAVPHELRGTYLGAAHPAILGHLTDLGVTTLELLPIHAFVDDARLASDGLTNYWGYNSIGFFAPHPGYASDRSPGAAVVECKAMIAAFHEAGIEVILDVVYNHTGEGGLDGPAMHFRGLDNASSYRHDSYRPGVYEDTTGTGNTLDAQQAHIAELIIASLHHWVLDYHVDGFRFDLAAGLGRTARGIDLQHGVLSTIATDPVLADVKLIAEPWDLGHEGYQFGNFPSGFSEWNDRFRNSVRDYWRGASCTYAALGDALAGSPSVFSPHDRGPSASINFVTCHDGMTLLDLVSYVQKHNEANGEGNRDGTDDNRSDNFGVEGITDDETVLGRRRARRKAFLTTLLLARGVPMLLGGDEIGRTQGGNNNAYCQDNPVSWLDWDSIDHDLVEFVSALLTLRARLPQLHDQRWSSSRWFDADGNDVHLDAEVDRERPTVLIIGHTLAIIVHAALVDCELTLPSAGSATAWQLVFDSATADRGDLVLGPKDSMLCKAQSVVALVADPAA